MESGSMMVGSSVLPSEQLYLYQMRRECRIHFPCPRCHSIVTSQQFEMHAQFCLNLDPATQCVWCLGKTSWSLHYKNQNLPHVLVCWKQFITLLPIAALPPLPRFLSHPSSSPNGLRCHERDLFGRTKLASLPPDAYELVWTLPLEDPPPGVPFEDANVSQAASYVRLYLRMIQDGFEFFHCMVNAVAFPRFLEILESDRGLSRLLPFSCWCDCGNTGVPEQDHHRHLIIASWPPLGRFKKKVWSGMPDTSTPDSGGHLAWIRRRPIMSALHFVNTLGYLSQRKSRCNRSGALSNGSARSRRSGTASRKHFWIFTSLPQWYRLPLVLQWDGGLMELIHQEFQHIPPDLCVRAPSLQRADNGLWQVALRDLPGIERFFRAPPVARDWKEVPSRTDWRLHLPRGRRMYFEEDASQREEGDGQAAAAYELGPRLYEVVRDEFWTLPKYQQMYLNVVQPFLYI